LAEYHAKGDEDRAIADFNESIRRGRRPKPTRMKVLTGNPGKRPLNRYEPRPNPVMPDCPPELGPAAQREWARLVGELSSLNMVTNLGPSGARNVLRGLCVAQMSSGVA
jgi:phage terminase small subunit